MSKKLQLTIAEPCHENWESMTTVEKGKFCGSCQKQVVDFTNMSDRQVAEFFKKPSTGSVCGRFMTDQLERDIEIPKKRIPWLKYFFSIALPAFFLSKASAQRKMGMVARPQIKDTTKIVVVPEYRMLGEVAATYEPQDKRILTTNENITGKVVNENGEAVPFASIETGRKTAGLMADDKGMFTISKDWMKKGRTIIVSSVGYDNKIIIGGEEEYKGGQMIVLLKSNVVLDEVVVSALGTIRCTRVTMGLTMIKGQTITTLVDTSAKTPVTIKPLPMEESKLLIYPNPAPSGGAVNLSFNKLEEGYYHLQLISLAGQLIQQKEIWIDAEARLLNLDIPTVAGGSYFIVLTNKTTGKKYSEKIIIQ